MVVVSDALCSCVLNMDALLLSWQLVDTLVQCSLRQILENGFFHADPHA